MDELVKTLKDFITRDLLYVVGGGTVGLAFCYIFDIGVSSNLSTAMSLLAAGIAYGIGYALQDGLSLTPIVTTTPVLSPGRMVCGLYRRFVRADWSPIKPDEFAKAQEAFTSIASDRDYAQWNRIVALKHIGSTLGSSGIVAAVLLAVAAVRKDGEGIAVALAAGCFILSTILLCLSWVKGAQQSQFVLSIYRRSLTAPHSSDSNDEGKPYNHGCTQGGNLAFLDDNDWIDSHRKRFAEAFGRSDELGTRCAQLLGAVDIHHDSLREAVVSILFARCIEHYNSLISNIERGWVASTNVAVRALIETVFTIAAVSQHDDVLDRYLQEDKFQRLALLKKLETVRDPGFKSLFDPDLKQKLEKQVKENKIQRLSTYFLAEKGGLLDWYLVVYALLTGPAHTKIRDLQHYLRVSSQGGVEAFSLSPTSDHTEGLLSTAGIAMLEAARHFERVFAQSLAIDRDEYVTFFKNLGDSPVA